MLSLRLPEKEKPKSNMNHHFSDGTAIINFLNRCTNKCLGHLENDYFMLKIMIYMLGYS